MSLGILSAMPQEIDKVLHAMTRVEQSTYGRRTFYKGNLFNKPVVLAFSNWGKVAAATTATQLIASFNVETLIFTGVAGALQEHLNIGDVVIGSHLYQHDMDARPLFKQFEIPILNKTAFETDDVLTTYLTKAANTFLSETKKHPTLLNAFNIVRPKTYKGGIASGDQFISSQLKIDELTTNLPDVLCVEMEGAAVAQVCYDYKVPFVIMRTISDKAKGNAHIDFQKFAENIASTYALGVLKAFLN
jgi:adenosylhomocysteine nucleosidase